MNMIYIRRRSKLFEICIVLCMIFFVVFALSLILNINNYKIITWQDYAEANFESVIEKDENGNDVEIKLVSTPEQLAGVFVKPQSVYADSWGSISSASGTYFRLKNNVDLSGKYWQSNDLNKNNTFDGNGFVISNLNISNYGGCVGFVAINNGTIKNVILNNANINSSCYSYCNIGGICGTNGGVLNNCNVVGTSYIKFGAYNYSYDKIIGGICGTNNGTVTNCSNSAEVSNGSHMGGIVGYNKGTVNKCFNSGKVLTTSCSYNFARIGGIIGESSSDQTILLCQNAGYVSGTGTQNSSVGGIVGYSYTNVSSCLNRGNVVSGTQGSGGKYDFDGKSDSSGTDESCCGGIVGRDTGKKIANCANSGNIDGYSKYNASDLSTNIPAGENSFEGVNFNIVDNVSFASKVNNGWYLDIIKNTDKGKESTISKGVYNNYKGGIVGYCTDSTSVSSCYNKGTINANNAYKKYFCIVQSQWRARGWMTLGIYTYNLKIKQSIGFDAQYYYGGIVGNNDSNPSLTNCRSTTNTSRTKYCYAKQELNKDSTKTKESTGWVDKSEYLDKMDSCEYYTYHDMQFSNSYNTITYKVKYNDSGSSYKTYATISIADMEDYVAKGTYDSSITLSDMGSNEWVVLSNIGYNSPVPIGLYW